jgi:transposase
MNRVVAGSTARTTADLIGIHRNTAASYFHRFRIIIAAKIEDESPVKGKIEADESYFGGKRKGKRAARKVPVFGLLKRGRKVYTSIIANTQSASLLPIIQQKVVFDSIVYTDTYKSYDALDECEWRFNCETPKELLKCSLNG